MRLPNGYGSVYKQKGKRRNPWCAVKTDKWIIENNKVLQKRYYLGSYPNRSEALRALSDYNLIPKQSIQNNNTLTFTDVYEKWSSEHFQNIVPSACRTWKSAYNHSKPLHNMLIKDIRVADLEHTIQSADIGSATKGRMKSLYNLMYRYALKYDIVDKNYAELCNSVKPGERIITRIPFSVEEIKQLWDAKNSLPFVDMILIGIYTGFRPQELATLKADNIHINERYIIGGNKTTAGKNRIVPIHHSILPIVRESLDKSKEINSHTLFFDTSSQTGPTMNYDKYKHRFDKIMNSLEMKHRPHDTRHTFITLAKHYKIDEYVLKRIVGHAITDVTESTYTHRNISDLINEIEKIKF